MAKIPKKVQVIADNLQKVEKAKASPAAVEVHAVEPMPKGPISFLGSKGKARGKKKKKEIVNVNKKEPVKELDKEERAPGYAGLARRIARGLVGEIRGVKFWFDD